MKFGFLDRWYEGAKDIARKKHAESTMGLIAFFESFIFPIPTSIFLIPMVQASPNKAWRYATVCLIMSVLGGIVGYGIGYLAYDTIALPVLEHLGKADKIGAFEGMADQYGALAVIGAGLTPFPYKVVTILSGMLHLNFGVFIIASVLSRGLQFYFLAAIVKMFGPQAEAIIKKHFALVSIMFFVLCVAAWFSWKAFHTSA